MPKPRKKLNALQMGDWVEVPIGVQPNEPAGIMVGRIERKVVSTIYGLYFCICPAFYVVQGKLHACSGSRGVGMESDADFCTRSELIAKAKEVAGDNA